MKTTDIMIDGTKYGIKTTLRAIKDLEKNFGGKKYIDVFSGMSDMGVEEQIKIIYNLTTAKDDMKLNEFTDVVYDAEELGVGGLIDILQLIMNRVQYPNLTDEEIEAKTNEVLEKQEKLQKKA